MTQLLGIELKLLSSTADTAALQCSSQQLSRLLCLCANRLLGRTNRASLEPSLLGTTKEVVP